MLVQFFPLHIFYRDFLAVYLKWNLLDSTRSSDALHANGQLTKQYFRYLIETEVSFCLNNKIQMI